MKERRDIVCSSVRLCPAKHVVSATARAYQPRSDAPEVVLRGQSRAVLDWEKLSVDGMPAQRLEVSLTIDRPEAVAALRRSGCLRWVGCLTTADGNTLCIGSPDMPATLSVSGSDSAAVVRLDGMRN